MVPSEDQHSLYYNEKDMVVNLESEVNLRCKSIAGYKKPTSIIVYNGEMPMTTTKKIKRGEVRELFQDLRSKL